MENKTNKDIKFENKTILIKVDFNVDIKEENDEVIITNDDRIIAALPTIKHAVDNNSKIVIFAYLGNIKNENNKKKLPIAKKLSELLDKEIVFSSDYAGLELENKIKQLKNKEILLVETYKNTVSNDNK